MCKKLFIINSFCLYKPTGIVYDIKEELCVGIAHSIF